MANEHDEHNDIHAPAQQEAMAPRESSATRPARPNPFDPARLRIAQDYLNTAPVQKIITNVLVRKPDRQWFVRVNCDEHRRLQTYGIVLKEEREELYLLDPALWEELGDLATPLLLVEAINRQGVLFLWYVKLPGPDGRTGPWLRSAFDAIEHAENNWVSVRWNGTAYDVYVAQGVLDGPKWPTEPFDKILELAFRDRMIDTADHPVVRRLRGEL